MLYALQKLWSTMRAYGIHWLCLQLLPALVSGQYVTGKLTSSTSSIAVNGTQGGVDEVSGFRPFRFEISSFQSMGPAWDLYILSLQEFMQKNQSDPLSYYQIAGMWASLIFSAGLLTLKASMDIQRLHGMVSMELEAVLVIVPTAQSFSQCGIDHTWPCSR